MHEVITSRCSVYEQRPAACRGFVCHDTGNQGRTVLAMLYRNRPLRRHLESEDSLPPVDSDLYWAENASRVPTDVGYSHPLHQYNMLSAGTWRYYKLDAKTGEVVFLGRRRSTKVPWSRGKYEAMVDEKNPARWMVADAAPVCAEETETAYPYDDIKATAPTCATRA